VAVGAVGAFVACDNSSGNASVHADVRQHRVIEPPAQNVRPLPPHAIRGDGVGPYRLGEPLNKLADQLPSGPRIKLYDIQGVVTRQILPAEDAGILIGGVPQGRASFVAVVGSEVARTETGIHVGSTRDELEHVLGPFVTDPSRARDPRLVVAEGLRNGLFVLDGNRIAAIVVAVDPAPVATAAPDACVRPTSPDDPKKFGACLATGELVSIDGDELTVRGADDRALAVQRIAGLLWAAPLRFDGDGRDELVAIARTEDREQRGWTLTAFRLDSGKLVRSLETAPLYQLTAANARWIGAELSDVDLYLELTSRPDSIEVGGLLTTRAGDKLRDVVVISPTSVARHRAKSAGGEAIDAGVPQTATPAAAPAPAAK